MHHKKTPLFELSLTQETAQDPEESGKDSSDGALGCVQISVTAATPMVEDADKEFLPQEEEESRDSPPEPEPEIQQQPQPTQMTASEVYNDTILEESEPEDDEPIKPPPKMAPPPLPPAAAAAAAQEKKSDPESPDPNAFEANFEAAFEANFDSAFDNDSEVPKQVVGGRASIPDELDTQQLARLQDLKESNA